MHILGRCLIAYLGVPVGGAVGGVAFVSLCIYLAIYTRRRKAQDRARHAPRLGSFDRQPYRHRSLRPGTINIERAYAVRCVEDSAPQSETLRSETDPRADYDSLVRELQRMREEIREKATVAHYTPNPTPVTAIIDGGVEAGLRSDIAILRGGVEPATGRDRGTQKSAPCISSLIGGCMLSS